MKPYFRAIEVYNSALMVRVVFPSNWKVYPNKGETIKVTPSETDSNEVVYYADSNEATYEDIFDLIEETIKANQDIVLKLKLLKEKADELKELFQSTSYEELLNLRFVIDKKKRKYTKKNTVKEEENKEEVIPEPEEKEEEQ